MIPPPRPRPGGAPGPVRKRPRGRCRRARRRGARRRSRRLPPLRRERVLRAAAGHRRRAERREGRGARRRQRRPRARRSATPSTSAWRASAPAAEEQVVESSEEPREIARIVLPPSQEDAAEPLVRPVGEGETAPTAATDEAALAGPRRVRTYVVRPDGTIVEGAAPAEAPPPEEAVGRCPPSASRSRRCRSRPPRSMRPAIQPRLSAIANDPGRCQRSSKAAAAVTDAASCARDGRMRRSGLSVIETPSAPEPVAAVAEEPPPAAPGSR